MEQIVMGVDIGGSHITAALIDLNSKEELDHSWSRAKLDSKGSADYIINAWAMTIETSLRSYPKRPDKINIAMPGPMDYKRGICKISNQDKYSTLFNVNIKEMLAVRLGFDPSEINFINDAACFLRGEMFSGSISGFKTAIGLTLGTGLGTSHFVNQTAHDSDLWKMPFKKGIAEDYISTRWFVKRFAELAGAEIRDVKDLVENHSLSPYHAVIFSEFSENLAEFIYRFIKKKMPLAAVIGGNIAQAEEYFLEDTRKCLAAKMGYSFPIQRSLLGEKAALIGAGSVFSQF